MAYDEILEQRVRLIFDTKRIKHESERMMGGLCFMVKGKICVGVEKNLLEILVGPREPPERQYICWIKRL